MFETLRQDLRYVSRAVLRTPGFAFVVALTLALGVGASATIFTLLDAVLFKPLPVPDAHELHVLYERPPGADDVDLEGGTSRWTRFSHWRFERLREAVPGARLAAMTRSTRFDVRDDARQAGAAAQVQLVSGNYFEVFRAPAAAGRVFTDEDNRHLDAHPVAVLAHGYWQRRFGGDPAIVGRSITINRVAFTVVGVTAGGFTGDRVERPVDVWIPLMMQHAVRYASNVSSYGDARDDEPWAPQERIAWLYLMLRAPGRIESVAARLERAYRLDLQHYAEGVTDPEFLAALEQRRLGITSFATGFSSLRRTYGLRLTVLMAMVGVLLLVACANAASLMLARATARRREIGIRLALGAARRQLIVQVLMEAMVLSLAGAASGVVVARWAAPLIAAEVLDTAVVPDAFGIDVRVIVFAAGLALCTTVLIGLVPALRATRADFVDTLGTTRDMPPVSIRGMAPLVVAQIACSLVLVVTGVWFARSLVNLSTIDPGFGHGRLVSTFVNTRNSGYTPEELPALYARVTERLAGVPGVESAAFAECTMLTGCSSTTDVRIEGYTQGSSTIPMDRNRVAPGYFATVGMRVVAGRGFEPGDATRPVAVVNQAFVRRYFGGRNPLGKRVGGEELDTEIIGVVADVRQRTIAAAPEPIYYLPLRAPAYAFSLDVRVRDNPAALVASIQRAVSSSEPRLIFDDFVTMDDRIERNLFRERLVAYLTAAFCGITVLLASLGLYGLLSYVTSRRRAEIGLRVALGAQRYNVIGMVVRDASRLLAAGVLIGIVFAASARQLVDALLFNVAPADAVTIAVVAAVLALATAAASYLPARRAASVNPVEALRSE